MKRDKLNFSKRHASVVKTTFLAMFFVCGIPMNVFANDSQTPIVLLSKLAKANCSEKCALQNFATRFNELFADFFDVNNNQPFAKHKANFLSVIDDLDAYAQHLDKTAHKEIAHLVKELRSFIALLDTHAQLLNKRANYANIIKLQSPLKPYAHLIPDAYLNNYNLLLAAIVHRLNC